MFMGDYSYIKWSLSCIFPYKNDLAWTYTPMATIRSKEPLQP